MSHSLGEVQALCIKAARGAGYCWGLAEEAGLAVRWLEERGLPGARALADLCESGVRAAPRFERGKWRGAGPLCPLATGAALSDFAGSVPAEGWSLPAAVVQPLLLAPLLAWSGLAFDPKGRTVRPAGTDMPPRAATRTRAILDDGTLAVLNRFAARTYAPATEASRLAGAGTGGLTDND